MKKFLSAIFAAVLGASALFAGDVEDVKFTVTKFNEHASKGEFEQCLTMSTSDFQIVDKAGGIMSREMIELTFLALDGEHFKECMIVAFMQQNGGRKPSPEEITTVDMLANDPDMIKAYKKNAAAVRKYLIATAELEYKTMKFVKVDVSGDNATVVYEHDGKDKSGKISTETSTTLLRKVDGVWKISKGITK